MIIFCHTINGDHSVVQTGAYPGEGFGGLGPPGHYRAPKKKKKKERKEKGKKKEEKEGKKGKRKKKIKQHDKKGAIQSQAGAPRRGSREENFRGTKLLGGGGVRGPFSNVAPDCQN